MDKKETLKNLKDLTQLNIDAVAAYEQALKNIDEKEIHRKIGKFRDDHKNHIVELSKLIRELGDTPPEMTKDFKGFLIAGFTAIRSATGTVGALKAMESNEKLVNKKYTEALKWDVEDKIRAVIYNQSEIEIKHLEYVEEAIEETKTAKSN